jgi:putative ABC transport system permease protein
MGLVLGLLALGVFVSFRIFRFSDITVDGSYPLGAAVTAVLLTDGFHPLLGFLAIHGLWPAGWVPAAGGIDPFVATPLSFLAGALAGATTGVLHTKFRINPLLSGILVMTALYSVNLRVMGKANQPLLNATTLGTYVERFAHHALGAGEQVPFLGRQAALQDLAFLAVSLVVTAAGAVLLYAFLRTDVGTALRATGDNDQMTRALGVNVDGMVIAGLALSNGLVALSGSLFAQYQGSADVMMGIGMIVWGLASVIIGEALVGGQHSLGLAIVGALMGSVLFRLLVAWALWLGLNPNDLKLIQAVFVFLALILPGLVVRLSRRKGAGKHA